jgi:hypothetical protein
MQPTIIFFLFVYLFIINDLNHVRGCTNEIRGFLAA